MGRSKRQTNEEILQEGGLDPYQEDYIRAELERMKGRGPLPTPEPKPEEPGWTDKVAEWPGAIGRKLRDSYNYWTSSPYRALEAPARALSTIAWPVTKSAELAGDAYTSLRSPTITEAVTGKKERSTLAQAGQNIQDKLKSKAKKYGELAGGYDESPGIPEFLGTMKWPFPSFSKAPPAKAAAENALKMGTAGAAYGAALETDKPEDQRDYLSGAGWGAGFGIGLGVLEPGARAAQSWWKNRKSPAGPDFGVNMPGEEPPPSHSSGPDWTDAEFSEIPKLPEPKPVRSKRPQPTVAGRPDLPRIEERPHPVGSELSPGAMPPPAVDTPIMRRPQIEHRPKPSEPIYAPGPIKTGEGTVIEMPGPVTRNPNIVEDTVARKRFEKVEPIAKPEPVQLEPPQELNIVQRPPVVTKKAIARPDVPQGLEPPPFVQEREVPKVSTVPNPSKITPNEIAAKPRHELPPELNQDLLDRVDYARDTMELAGNDRGNRFFTEVDGQGSTQNVVGYKSPTADWYKRVTIEGGMKPQDVERALAKIVEDHGKDKGKYVERVKQALLEDRQFPAWQKAYGKKSPVDEFDAEMALAPEEPIHPSDLPDEFLPPLETQTPEIPEGVGLENPFGQLKKNELPAGEDFALTPGSLSKPAQNIPGIIPNRSGQQEISVPPPTIGERPIIGREATPEEAPLFSKSAQLPEPKQLNLQESSFPAAKENAPRFHEVDPISSKEIAQEFHVEHEGLQGLWDKLNNERGSVQLGKGVTLVERGLSQRRMAERHPEFKPIYQTSVQRGEFASSVKHDIRSTMQPYFSTPEPERKAIDQFLLKRRRLAGEVSDQLRASNVPQAYFNHILQREVQRRLPVPPHMAAQVKSVDDAMASSWQLMNDVRATKGLEPMEPDLFYVPMSRSGDYLVVMEQGNTGASGQAGTAALAPRQLTPNTVPRVVSAFPTLREAEAFEKHLQQQYPGANTVTKMASGAKGDQPALDFGTLALLEKAGLLSPDEYEQAIKQFGLPPEFSGHFRRAAKILGEAQDLANPFERYIDSLGNYTAKFLHDDVMKQQISQLKDPSMRQYAERYREYLNTKPEEWARARGAVAVWDLMANVGSMVQNASQVPVLGIPNLQRAVGAKKGIKVFKDAWAAVRNPSAQDKLVLEMAEREGHIRPINAQELFGTSTTSPNSIELGSPYVQRMVDRGTLSQSQASTLRKPIDATAGAMSKAADVFDSANQTVGQKISYALHRLTGNNVQISEEAAKKASPFLMQGFSAIEEVNRKWSILAGYRAGIEQGMNPGRAYEYAKAFSRDVNFDYSPISRPELFRGRKAIVGLFGTYPIEAMSTYSKFAREAARGKVGPFATAMGAFWTMAGLKGIPFVEDIDTYGPKPGILSENLPDWVYHGPASAMTGLDIASKYKMRIPIISDIPNVANGEFDLGTMPVAQPIVQGKRTIDWFLDSPKDAPSTQKAIERLLPPSLRSLATAGRWAGLGPAGSIEQGTVGTIKGHTPGPNDEGKKDFFHPTWKDILGKSLTFTPLELSKQYQRGRLASVITDRSKEHTGKLVQQVANELDRNGTAVNSEAMRELASKHQRTYQALIKAHNRRQSGERGSTFEIFRKSQEPKPPKEMAAAGR